MILLPHDRLTVSWQPDLKGFNLSLPWLSLDVDVIEEERGWIEQAIASLHQDPLNPHSQRFLKDLREYPIFYTQPRTLDDFNLNALQPCPLSEIDTTSPQTLLATLGLPLPQGLEADVPTSWTWDWEKILSKCRIEGTDLYDPLSFVTYLICYRLAWESDTWAGQDGLGQLLDRLRSENEPRFFQALGWITRQSWEVTMKSCTAMQPALTHFATAKDLITHFVMDEAGHYKFMDQVFADLELNREDFSVGPATTWMLSLHAHMAHVSPLAFSAMINLFEAAFYEGEDPISRIVKQSSKPHAARGYDLHYKINQEHRHCDMPVLFAQRLAPQTEEQVVLTLALFELTLLFLDAMERRLETFLPQPTQKESDQTVIPFRQVS